MKVNKVVFVTDNIRPAKICAQIARELRDESHIYIYAEGPSVQEWQDSHLVQRMLNTTGRSANDIVSDFNPTNSTFVIGLSSPFEGKIEDRFVQGLKKLDSRKCAVIMIDDNWGAFRRTDFAADLYLTIDRVGRELIQKERPNSEVVIMGDMAATSANEEIPKETKDLLTEARMKTGAEGVFLLCSQKWSQSEDIVRIAIRSINRSFEANRRAVLIPRWHPGAKDVDKEHWNFQINILKCWWPGSVFEIPDTADFKHNTEHIAALCDGTFATTGAALRSAGYAGKLAICVNSVSLRPLLKADCGSETHPLVDIGAGIQLESPIDVVALSESVTAHDAISNAEELLEPIPFNAQLAAEDIRNFHH